MAETKTPKKTYHLGTGRRKTAVARVRLCEGTGQMTINGKPLEQFFTEDKDRNAVVGPLDRHRDAQPRGRDRPLRRRRHLRPGRCDLPGRRPRHQEDVQPHAPARPRADGDDAIVTMAKQLRDSGYLTRDSRMKERKKYGRKGARKSFQFSKT